MATFGTIIAWLICIALICCYPVTEFARGMASNPSSHSRSKGGAILSLVGAAIALLLIFG